MADTANPNPNPAVDDLYKEADKGSVDDLYNEADKPSSNGLTDFIYRHTAAGSIDDLIKDYHNYAISKGPYQGSLSDYFFTQTPAGRVLSAFGQGVKEGYGSQPSALHAEIEKEVRGLDKDGKMSYIQAANAALMRPAAAAYDTLVKGGLGLVSGISGAATEAGQELSQYSKEASPFNPLGYAAGYSGEVLQGLGAGAIPEEGQHVFHGEPEFKPRPDLRDTVLPQPEELQTARAHGLIGEGEEGYFKTVQPTEEQLQGRREAAEEAGMTPEEQVRLATLDAKYKVPSIDDLARDMYPDLFEKVDRLKNDIDVHRASVEYLQQAESEGIRTEDLERSKLHPDISEELDRRVAERDQAIKSSEYWFNKSGFSEETQNSLIRLKQAEEDLKTFSSEAKSASREGILDADAALRDKIERVAKAREDVKNSLASETEYGAMYRDYVQSLVFKNAQKFEELKQDVSDAQRHASELIPEQKIVPAEEANAKPQGPGAGLKSKAVQAKPEDKINASIKARQKNLDQRLDREIGSRLTAETNGPKPIKGGDKITAGSAKNTVVEAAMRGLNLDEEGLPEYERIAHQDQYNKAYDYIQGNNKEALNVLDGKIASPEGIAPDAILNTFKKIALETGDVKLAQRVANSPIHTERSIIAQRLGFRSDDIDPSDIIKNIQDARKAKQKTKLEQQTVEQIKASVDKAIKDFKPDWENFLKSIECDY